MRAAPARPLWLITLADLSLLLVGCFVFVQATAQKPNRDRAAISASIRDAFGGDGEARIAVEANALRFVTGSAETSTDTAAVIDWAKDALADPRTRLIVTGYADGTPADAIGGSGLALAAARADAVVDALDGAVPADRLRTGATIAPGASRVTLTISYDP